MPLVVWAVWVGLITLHPFAFVLPAQPFSTLLFDHDVVRRVPDIVLNLLLFLPLGAWLHGEGRRRSVPIGTIVMVTAAAGSLLSLGIECLQLLMPTRFPSILDVAANTAGALMGVYAHRAWVPRLEAATARMRTRITPAVGVGLVGIVGVAPLVTAAGLQTRTHLSNWDDGYPLLVGNERTGDRPWRGRVFTMEMTDAATTPAAVRRFARDGRLMMPGRPVAAFDFSGSAPYSDSTAHVPDLDWTSAPHATSAGAAAVSAQAWLQTEEPAAGMVRRIRASNAFTLRVVSAADGKPEERGRIVSNSIDTGARNFSLEQRGESLVFRWRTPHTGENAGHPEAVIPGVFTDDQVRDILATYDGATLRVAIAGSGLVHRVALSPGSSLAAVRVRYLPASELGRYRLVYAALLFVPAALVAGLVMGTHRYRVVWSALWVLALTAMFEGTLMLVSGRSMLWENIWTTALVGGLMLATALALSPLTRDPGAHDPQA